VKKTIKEFFEDSELGDVVPLVRVPVESSDAVEWFTCGIIVMETLDGKDYDCAYEYAGEITCEECIVNGGRYDPRRSRELQEEDIMVPEEEIAVAIRLREEDEGHHTVFVDDYAIGVVHVDVAGVSSSLQAMIVQKSELIVAMLVEQLNEGGETEEGVGVVKNILVGKTALVSVDNEELFTVDLKELTVMKPKADVETYDVGDNGVCPLASACPEHHAQRAVELMNLYGYREEFQTDDINHLRVFITMGSTICTRSSRRSCGNLLALWKEFLVASVLRFVSWLRCTIGCSVRCSVSAVTSLTRTASVHSAVWGLAMATEPTIGWKNEDEFNELRLLGNTELRRELIKARRERDVYRSLLIEWWDSSRLEVGSGQWMRWYDDFSERVSALVKPRSPRASVQEPVLKTLFALPTRVQLRGLKDVRHRVGMWLCMQDIHSFKFGWSVRGGGWDGLVRAVCQRCGYSCTLQDDGTMNLPELERNARIVSCPDCDGKSPCLTCGGEGSVFG
jgi:hypothetical protein